MSNETVLLLVTAISLFAVLAASRLGKEYLYAAIISNLFFVSVFGSKLFEAFGLISNIGNVFYACVFYATYSLIEQYGEESARRSIWFGLYAVVCFVFLAPLVGNLSGGLSGTDAALLALAEAFPRIAVASIFAYILVQQLNIWLYCRIAEHTQGTALWLRVLGAVTVAQLADSVFFFYLAFAGTVATPVLYQSLMAGFALKVAIGIVTIPLLYLGRRMDELYGRPE